MDLPNVLAMSTPLLIALVLAIGLALLLLRFLVRYVGLYVMCVFAHAQISLLDLIKMDRRKVDLGTVVQSKIMSVKAGLSLKTDDLVNHYLAKGRVPNVVRALIAADRAGIALDWERASELDLAGVDVLERVRRAWLPRLIVCVAPDTGEEVIRARTSDGHTVLVKASVVVRLPRDVATEPPEDKGLRDTVTDYILELIGSGSADDPLFRSAEAMKRAIMDARLDEGTAFSIEGINVITRVEAYKDLPLQG
jgi:uncharacterized protein YqfA (UPF0365 family)